MHASYHLSPSSPSDFIFSSETGWRIEILWNSTIIQIVVLFYIPLLRLLQPKHPLHNLHSTLKLLDFPLVRWCTLPGKVKDDLILLGFRVQRALVVEVFEAGQVLGLPGEQSEEVEVHFANHVIFWSLFANAYAASYAIRVRNLDAIYQCV